MQMCSSWNLGAVTWKNWGCVRGEPMERVLKNHPLSDTS